MPRCPKCGKEVSEEVNYCPSCGSELKIDVEALKLKVEDLRHNQKMSWGVIGLGIMCMILTMVFPYHPYMDTPIKIMLILGAIALIIGVLLNFYYGYQRFKLMQRLPK